MKLSPLPSEQSRRMIQTELRKRVIPWAQQGVIERVLLAEHPLQPRLARTSPSKFSVSVHEGMPLPEKQRIHSQDYLHRWPEFYMHSMRSPRLCCVVQGEVDWRIGVTERASASVLPPGPQSDYHVVSMKAGSFLVIPPGTPYSDGKIPHWERTGSSQPESLVLWIQMLPIGFFCHFCRSCNGEHNADALIYVPDTVVKHQIDLIIQELREHGPHFEHVVQAALTIILLRVERTLSEQRFVSAHFTEALLTAELETVSQNDYAVWSACDYIQANLHQDLNLELVAEQTVLSSKHLNRRFRAELGRSVMQYVRERRMSTAKALLRGSDLPVQEIARMVGYPKASQFARTFSNEENITPSAYRNQARG